MESSLFKEESVNQEPNESQKHPYQRFLDNPWILLLLGVVVPGISYLLWGWLEILYIPVAQLP